MPAASGTAEHWDEVYAHGDTTRSWFQDQPVPSLRMLDRCGVHANNSVIDVGGGASTLVDALVERGYADVTVLDISTTGLSAAQRRLGPAAGRVQWLVADALTWQPTRTYDGWHDRAVLHFLTAEADRRRYVQVLDGASRPGAVAVFATFAPDGPQQCSGLPTRRYSPGRLGALLGLGWQCIAEDRELHTTPGGSLQPFIWAAFRRQA
jgi:trans-aconitate methyltransferase